MDKLVLAYAAPDALAADRIARTLSSSGIAVEKSLSDGFRVTASAAAAKSVLVLWSRHAAAAPGLRRAALAAKSTGALSVASLDGAKPPPSLRTARSLSLRGDAQDARALVRAFAAKPAPEPEPQSTTTPIEGAPRMSMPQPRPQAAAPAPQAHNATILQYPKPQETNDRPATIGVIVTLIAFLAFSLVGFFTAGG